MGLNIKNQRVHDLAREAASRSGLTQTGVIEKALELYLSGLPEGQNSATIDKAQALSEIAVEFSRGISAKQLQCLKGGDLYDENGLPA